MGCNLSLPPFRTTTYANTVGALLVASAENFVAVLAAIGTLADAHLLTVRDLIARSLELVASVGCAEAEAGVALIRRCRPRLSHKAGDIAHRRSPDAVLQRRIASGGCEHRREKGA